MEFFFTKFGLEYTIYEYGFYKTNKLSSNPPIECHTTLKIWASKTAMMSFRAKVFNLKPDSPNL